VAANGAPFVAGMTALLMVGELAAYYRGCLP